MNARMYDAVLGRFLSPDNYVQDPYNNQSFNRYGYVWNNPLSYNDPSGEFLVSALIGAAIGVLTNGINNVINDRPFFRGAGKVAPFDRNRWHGHSEIASSFVWHWSCCWYDIQHLFKCSLSVGYARINRGHVLWCAGRHLWFRFFKRSFEFGNLVSV
jgi:hypothetical protein